MKLPGLSGSELTSGKWYLLEVVAMTFKNPNDREKILISTEWNVIAGEHKGYSFDDAFMIGSKAGMNRLSAMLSQAGYPKELMQQNEFDDEKIIGLKVWAKISVHEKYGEQTGFDFLPENQPPEEERGIDYAKQDAADAGTSGTPAFAANLDD